MIVACGGRSECGRRMVVTRRVLPARLGGRHGGLGSSSYILFFILYSLFYVWRANFGFLPGLGLTARPRLFAQVLIL